jgi:hypothetical protein
MKISIGNHIGRVDVENTLWLDLLRPFVAAKDLYISKKFVPRIAPDLQILVGGKNDRSFAHPGEYFLGAFSAVATLP